MATATDKTAYTRTLTPSSPSSPASLLRSRYSAVILFVNYGPQNEVGAESSELR